MPLPWKLPSVPPVGVTSVRLKLVEGSLRVKVMVSVSPIIRVPVPARREVAQAFAEVLEAALGTPHGSTEGDRAWGLVFLFPRLILRPLPSGATGDRRSGVMEVRRVMTRRLQWLRAGRIGELIALDR